eukprot:scaffold106791_cov20-Tisochrysis_lutea.AAC.3
MALSGGGSAQGERLSGKQINQEAKRQAVVHTLEELWGANIWKQSKQEAGLLECKAASVLATGCDSAKSDTDSSKQRQTMVALHKVRSDVGGRAIRKQSGNLWRTVASKVAKLCIEWQAKRGKKGKIKNSTWAVKTLPTSNKAAGSSERSSKAVHKVASKATSIGKWFCMDYRQGWGGNSASRLCSIACSHTMLALRECASSYKLPPTVKTWTSIEIMQLLANGTGSRCDRWLMIKVVIGKGSAKGR